MKPKTRIETSYSVAASAITLEVIPPETFHLSFLYELICFPMKILRSFNFHFFPQNLGASHVGSGNEQSAKFKAILTF